jgi:hypothetical protein
MGHVRGVEQAAGDYRATVKIEIPPITLRNMQVVVNYFSPHNYENKNS